MLKEYKQKHDNKIKPLLDKFSNVWSKDTKQYNLASGILTNETWGICCNEEEHIEKFYELVESIFTPQSTFSTSKNFFHSDLVSLINPEFRNNPIFSELCDRLYEASPQRGSGKGEILISLICENSEKKKHKDDDICIGGKNIQMKADNATIHQEEENDFRCVDKLNLQYFGLKQKQIVKEHKKFYPLPTFKLNGTDAREYYSKMYPKWGKSELDTIEKVWNDTQNPDTRSDELGYIVLCEYVKFKKIDSILFTEKQKNGYIKAVHITDFTDKKFILDNIKFKPQKTRGGSTQACPDGLVNVSIK